MTSCLIQVYTVLARAIRPHFPIPDPKLLIPRTRISEIRPKSPSNCRTWVSRQRHKLIFKLMTTDARYDKEVLIASHLERLEAARGAAA